MTNFALTKACRKMKVQTPNIEKKAAKLVAEKAKFAKHLTTYLSVGLFFLLLNIFTGFGDWWFQYPMLGWGIGLLLHAFNAYNVYEPKNSHELSEKRTAQLTNFNKHVGTFAVVNAFLFGINLVSGGDWWFQYPLLGWGLAIVLQYFKVYGWNNEAWKEKEFEKERQKLARKHGMSLPDAEALPDYRKRPQAQERKIDDEYDERDLV